MNKRIFGGLFCASLFFLTLVSCTNNSSSSSSKLSGNIVIDGSSTVYPITEIVAEEFTYENPDVKVTVAESGTGGGMKKFVEGEIDIVNASRKIKDSELEQAKANGIDVLELVVANDGISVVVNSENDFATDLTKEELAHIFRNENPAKYWSDVREGFPNELIKVYTPGTASGTFEFFTEVVNDEAKSQREDAILSEDDNVLVKGVSEDKYSIGYFGYSYYEANKDKINLVSIDGIAPSSETINDGTYLLSRPLFIYFDKNDLSKPEIQAFIEFYLTNAYELADDVQLVPLNKSEYESQLNNLK
ncbi:PstS family phosphate ABC transporter substrate-binding protein [Candidatus Arthromitus sp. SFB-turkey]|uniref:PstS family phosphate ABC transporter substrate-binding protein n=1 Tax=Candidatus Arthromitus sp. SFB-turkey TaxID=1840217 RepID=UPI0007F4ED17|nr:PstS family phosphate ABC transporter substrate-binding protein [Candidatus Arthromitus sp. SFB-turkey]OAT87612.1 phosphate ABC transporter substrate-binding protein [Candidatus Arthromitus sp. SFB-turkey]